MEEPFAIAIFDDEDSVQGIRSSWLYKIKDNIFCKYPKSIRSTKSLVKSGASAGEDWPSYPCRVKIFCSTYEDMLEQEDAATNRTEQKADSDDSFVPASDEEPENLIPLNDKTKNRPNNVSHKPRKKWKVDNVTPSVFLPNLKPIVSSKFEARNKSLPLFKKGNNSNNELRNIRIGQSSKENIMSSDMFDYNVNAEDNSVSMMKIILNNQQKLLYEQAKMKHMIIQSCATIDTKVVNVTEEFRAYRKSANNPIKCNTNLPRLPILNRQELDELEELLDSDSEIKEALIHQICNFALGNSLRKSVHGVMNHAMTAELASTFTLQGKTAG